MNTVTSFSPPPLSENENALYQLHNKKVSKAMSGSNDHWSKADDKAKLARFNLNQEFQEKALLKDKVFYLWYPGQTIPIAGHTHFEVEHLECFAAGGDVALFKARNIPPKEHKGRPYFRFNLRVTPQELANLNGYLDKTHFLWPSTCSGNTASIIAKTTAINIPFPFSTFPLLSGSYLSLRKLAGWNRVSDITFVHKPGIMGYLPALSGGLIELAMVSMLSLSVARTAASFLHHTFRPT